MPEEPIETIDVQMEKALSDQEIPKIYGNGFMIAMGVGDVSLLFKNGPKSVAVVNLSYTVAKTLAVKLSASISKLEEKTKNKIMVTDEINKAFKEEKN